MNLTAPETIDWEKAVEGLHMISAKYVPIHTRAMAVHARGPDRFWQITFADGRIGWGESLAANAHRTNSFYVPRDVADEPWLKVAATAGYNTAWATSAAAAHHPVLSNIIRRAAVERQQQLDADATPVTDDRLL